MHILNVARRFTPEDWGGTETVIFETSKELQKLGNQVELFCTKATAKTDNEELDSLKIKRFSYFYPYLGLSKSAKELLNKKGGSPFSFALLKALKHCPAPDIFHLHTLNRIGAIGAYAARKRKIPYVVSIHGGAFDIPFTEAESMISPTKGTLEWGKILGWWVGSRKVLHHASAILCVGKNEQILTQKRFPNKKVFYLPNGVHPERFATGDGNSFRHKYQISASAKVVLTVARIDSQKNQLFVLKQLPELLAKAPNLHLIFIGPITNQNYYQMLKQRIQEHRLNHVVTLIPGLDSEDFDLRNSFHAADLFLLPSIHEPFGIVILEAWAAGLPVIASRVGGVPLFVEDQEDAILFNLENPKEFQEKFLFLLKNNVLQKKLADSGKIKAQEQYSWTKITSKLNNIYLKILQNKRE